MVPCPQLWEIRCLQKGIGQTDQECNCNSQGIQRDMATGLGPPKAMRNPGTNKQMAELQNGGHKQARGASGSNGWATIVIHRMGLKQLAKWEAVTTYMQLAR